MRIIINFSESPVRCFNARHRASLAQSTLPPPRGPLPRVPPEAIIMGGRVNPNPGNPLIIGNPLHGSSQRPYSLFSCGLPYYPEGKILNSCLKSENIIKHYSSNVKSLKSKWSQHRTNWLIVLMKSCTTWDVKNLANNGINYLSTGAGFLPSTISTLDITKPLPRPCLWGSLPWNRQRCHKFPRRWKELNCVEF